MPKQKSIREALENQIEVPIVDVRSEGEFAQGHIPEAISLPLFNNAERAEIGTLYKQRGQQPAILRGLEIVGPKMRTLAEAGLKFSRDGRVAVQCWRGGMRSASVAWLFENVGLTVDTVVGGYKSYRRLCLELFTSPWQLEVIGGKTGSRKTEILHDLAAKGLNVIDLEALANHRGSAFGAIPSSVQSLGGVEAQPTQEHFENLLGYELLRCQTENTLFVEDESMLIGRLHIPQPFWLQMRVGKVVVVEWPLEKRIEHLLKTYKDPEEKLRTSLTSIRKRLGDDRYNRALAALADGHLDEVCRIALDYYDRAYAFGLSKRDPATLSVVSGEVAVDEILKLQ